MYKNNKARKIPTINFILANERISAEVQSHPASHDEIQISVKGLHSPSKYEASSIDRALIRLVVDDLWYSPVDMPETSAIKERGYEEGVDIAEFIWKAGGIVVTDQFFIPPEEDVLIEVLRLKNTSSKEQSVKLFGILCPPQGRQKRAYYDGRNDMIFVEGKDGKNLGYGFVDRRVSEYQVGMVSTLSDVYLDLEDKRLSQNNEVSDAIVNCAISVDLGVIRPGEEVKAVLFIASGSSKRVLKESITHIREKGSDTLCKETVDYWRDWLKKSYKLKNKDKKIRKIYQTGLIILKANLANDGGPLGASLGRCYRGIWGRNGAYTLQALDETGFHQEAEKGYRLFKDYEYGSGRFLSDDENDQFGILIHCFYHHYGLTKNKEFLKEMYPAISRMASLLIDLIYPPLGLIYSKRSIHEWPPISRGFETYANTMAYRGLADASKIAKVLGKKEDEKEWKRGALTIQKGITKHLYSEEKHTFGKRIFEGELDCTPSLAMLTPPIWGVIEPKDAKVSNTIDFVINEIWDKKIGGLYRYPLHLQPQDEICYGGPWVSYTSWLGQLYIRRGEIDKAKECINWVKDNTPDDTNTLAEHFSLNHIGERGYYRIWMYPGQPETWATAEFIKLLIEYDREVF